MKTVASSEIDRAREVLELLKKQAIPAELRTVTQENGLEMTEIMVEDIFFDRDCDLVEAWDAEQRAAAKRSSGVYCRQCGSRNYDRKWDERIGYTYKCRDCGYEFGI